MNRLATTPDKKYGIKEKSHILCRFSEIAPTISMRTNIDDMEEGEGG